MKRRFAGLWALTLLVLTLLAAPIHAQTLAVPARRTGYDISKETTLTGTVTSVIKKASPGMMIGSHLLVATPSGNVDASLGRFGLLGKDAPSVAPGQYVEVTGIMKTLRNQQVFVTRLLKVADQVYMIRNTHGIALRPLEREYLSQSAGQQGVQP